MGENKYVEFGRLVLKNTLTIILVMAAFVVGVVLILFYGWALWEVFKHAYTQYVENQLGSAFLWLLLDLFMLAFGIGLGQTWFTE